MSRTANRLTFKKWPMAATFAAALVVLLGAGAGTSARSEEAPPKPTCHDNAKNGDETDVDCGGSACPKCGLGKACSAVTDCSTGACTNSACAFPERITCHDNAKNGDETDVDCGGPKCPKCTLGKACTVDKDCAPGACTSSVCAYPERPTCIDNVKNGQESDVDCGGPKCTKCPAAKACTSNDDCKSGKCGGGTCGE